MPARNQPVHQTVGARHAVPADPHRARLDSSRITGHGSRNARHRPHNSPLNSPCAAAIPAPGVPANTAARFAALPRSTAAPARTSLFPDTRGPGCSAGNAAARNAALPRRVPAKEWLRQSGSAQSDTRQYRCRDCQIPDPDQWLGGTPQWPHRCAPESDTSSPGTCGLPRWDANPAMTDIAPRRVRNRLPSEPDRRPAALPMRGSEFPGSCFIVSMRLVRRQKYEGTSRARMETCTKCRVLVLAKEAVTKGLACGGVAICPPNVQNKGALGPLERPFFDRSLDRSFDRSFDGGIMASHFRGKQ